MKLKLTTWNTNSVRLRGASLARIVADIDPDVLCLQETKVADELFPHAMVEDLGYPHVYAHGQKGYHGVAILSKLPLTDTGSRRWCGIDHSRHAFCRLPGGIELHNFYIPAGGDIPDPALNVKFKHKLDMLADISAWLADEPRAGRKMILVGDLNIAPLETDVWSHKQLLDVVSHTPVEVAALAKMQDSFGFVDAVRHIIPPAERLYSWWSYRNRDWAASDRGRRLDHVWITPALVPALRDAHVHRTARSWDNPSDHVPVTVEFDV